MKGTLQRLAEWYSAQCDGLWEHQQGITVTTIDNPGFSVTISLRGTSLEKLDFERVEENYQSDDHWFVCWKEDCFFRAAGSPDQLEQMIECFLTWVTSVAGK